MNKDQQWIRSLQNGHQEILGEIYLRYKRAFLDFAKRYPIETDEVLDIYQDSIIILYENIKQGKLNRLKSSIKTYLYAIGKYKIFAYLKAKPKDSEHLQTIEAVEEMTIFEINTAEEQLKRLQQAYRQLGPKCQEVLRLFYYQGKTIEDIKNTLSYESKDTVKSQKSRCLKQLKEIVRNNENR
ncbi:RNA polymerase sigma factor [Sunxiuqinia elliptica]|uniref:RNA polymerase sigma factor (Sigma-70 family) n=1 Tax=Sunxiuqinia elliptica TaxID=655355 RepID=A0A4R6H4F3_9BACT|nr:sigma-70 family RNA polymerase sigma factor [Sunxiuqinia elliptica]TDO02784.1 RNA polymerase sigma factor (sigma-70 family) [Sunxiuqinia elliptica]TDO58477.1 RNA polymerase sigma factor (sigma-70 family) [Sunxiuqinia elliptica]